MRMETKFLRLFRTCQSSAIGDFADLSGPRCDAPAPTGAGVPTPATNFDSTEAAVAAIDWMGALAPATPSRQAGKHSSANSGNRIQRRSAGSRSGRFLRRPVRIDNELFGGAFVEVSIPLRRLLQRNDGRIARFGGMNFVVQDRHHELAVVT